MADSPILLTPGPLTTSETVRRAMLRDWGSRDRDFIELNASVRRRLLAVAHAEASHVAVPMQGSGTFAVEAMLGTLVPASGKLLVLSNGAYGERMLTIASRHGRRAAAIRNPEREPNDVEELDRRLAGEPDITHVATVHCETTTGMRNPIERIAEVVARHGRSLLIDAMSAFGALSLDARSLPFDALAASSNKCLEGVPGVGFVLVRPEVLEKARGNAPSLALDLHDQHVAMEATGQWRFTPPTHVLAALHQALRELDAEGGVAGRAKRYRENLRILLEGMRAMEFEPLLPDDLQAPIIVTFRMPADPRFDFGSFYDRLHDKGFVIYPGKLTREPSFRIGCIGRIDAADMRRAVAAIRTTLQEMGVASGRPAPRPQGETVS